jgi:hypothetical protein
MDVALVDPATGGTITPPPMREVAIKCVFIAVLNIFMIAFLFVFFPLDWNTFMGSNPGNPAGARQTLTNSWLCLAHNQFEGCGPVRKWFGIFSAIFSLMTLGTTILNRFSPPLAAMLMQVGSPVCTLMLLRYPNWGTFMTWFTPVDKAQTQGAVALVMVGAIILGLWEMLTRARMEEKRQAEAGIQGDEQFLV